jgi:hypothetical protein
MIPWHVVALDKHSSCLPHIAACASSVTSQFVEDEIFLVYSGVLIVMFFWDMYSCAFTCLVLLVGGFTSLPFLYRTCFFLSSMAGALVSAGHIIPFGSCGIPRFSQSHHLQPSVVDVSFGWCKIFLYEFRDVI